MGPCSYQIRVNGQRIVLLWDLESAGGYPKIATVISADLPALGRLAAGATVAFEPVTIEQAEAARRAFVAEIDRLHERIVPLPCPDVLPMLLACNLISRVVDGAAA